MFKYPILLLIKQKCITNSFSSFRLGRGPNVTPSTSSNSTFNSGRSTSVLEILFSSSSVTTGNFGAFRMLFVLFELAVLFGRTKIDLNSKDTKFYEQKSFYQFVHYDMLR